MCAGDDKNCPEFELHHRKFKETLDRERRSFLRSSFAAAGPRRCRFGQPR